MYTYFVCVLWDGVLTRIFNSLINSVTAWDSSYRLEFTVNEFVSEGI